MEPLFLLCCCNLWLSYVLLCVANAGLPALPAFTPCALVCAAQQVPDDGYIMQHAAHHLLVCMPVH